MMTSKKKIGFTYKLLVLIPCAVTLFLISTPWLTKLHVFLSLTKPVHANVLVIEGWLFDYMLDAATEEIESGKYEQIITTGRIIQEPYPSISKNITNSAYYCKKRLIFKGVDPYIIEALPATNFKYHTTYHTALATKEWLMNNNIKAINVFTGGPHGRKTYLIYKKIFKDDIEVGIISCKIEHYDPVRWWTSTRGIWVTTRYTIGYLYALIWDF